MASPAQVTANIANAAHSTGPRTETGKASSSGNSLKHGLPAQTVLLPGEDEAIYRTMCQRMVADFNPGAEIERILVQNLCNTQWRIDRCSRLELYLRNVHRAHWQDDVRPALGGDDR